MVPLVTVSDRARRERNIGTDQELLPLADDGSCDSGWCFT